MSKIEIVGGSRYALNFPDQILLRPDLVRFRMSHIAALDTATAILTALQARTATGDLVVVDFHAALTWVDSPEDGPCDSTAAPSSSG